MFQQIIWNLEKELRYALRDTDVLIYSVLVPLLIYPTMLLVASEVLLWQMSQAQQNLKVYITDASHMAPHLYQALVGTAGIKVTDSANPQHDLQIGKLDAIVTGEEKKDRFNFTTFVGSKKGYMAANKLNQALVEAQTKTQKSAYKKYKVPADVLSVCTVNETRLVPFTPTQARVESKAPLGILAALVIGLLQIGLASGVNAVCVFAEEKEKKTFETTLTLPVPRFALTAGKWLAASTISLFSGMANIFAVGGAAIVVCMQAQTTQKQNWGAVLLFIFNSDTSSYLLAVLILLLASGLSTALCLLFVSSCRTFKDAQGIVTYPMLFIITLPMLAFVPGIEASPWMNWVPFTNLLLCLKHPQIHLSTLFIALGETLAIIVFSLYWAARIFFSEKTMAGTTGSIFYQRPHQQSESI